jgi:hypothetical protein
MKQYSLETGPLGTVHLIDTPGLDEFSLVRYAEVFHRINNFTRASSLSNGILDGIIFLQPINSARRYSRYMSAVYAFRRLLKPKFYNRMVLATTMWNKVALDIGEKRESELCSSTNVWGDMIRKGCRVIRLPRDRQSALALLDTFVKPDVKTGFTPVGRIGTSSALPYRLPIEIAPSKVLQDWVNERKRVDLMRPYSNSVSTYRALDFELGYSNIRNRRQVKVNIGSPVSEDLKLQEVSGRKVTLTKQLRQFKAQLNENIALVTASRVEIATMKEILFLITVTVSPLGFYITV